MSGIEVAGIVLGAVPLLISALDYYGETARSYAKWKGRVKENGPVVTFLLNTLFSDATFVMDRVERYVLQADEQQVVAFMKSYTSSFNMIGVAGAIIAQVAISAISLTGLEDSHWTAEAFFIASVVTGCLSVFFSCAISPAFHGLHSAEDIKDFLTKPTPSANTKNFNKFVSELRKMNNWINTMTQDDIDKLQEIVESGKWKVASAYAAIMLVVPMTLLNVALNTLLIGLGIYLGKLYTARLVPSYGSGSIGILVFYLTSVLFGIGMYYIAQSLKYLEGTPLARWHKILYDFKKNNSRDEHAENNTSNEDRNTSAPPPSPGPFRQSRHVREGHRVRFTTDDDNVNHAVNPDGQHATEEPEISREDNTLPLVEEYVSPDPPVTSNTAGPHETAVPPNIDLSNIQNILKELIRAQEESLRVNQRLLAAFNGGE